MVFFNMGPKLHDLAQREAAINNKGLTSDKKIERSGLNLAFLSLIIVPGIVFFQGWTWSYFPT